VTGRISRIDELFRLADRQIADPPSSTPDSADELSGKILSHYRVISRLGGGGMATVYRAEDLKLRRHVALKLLAPVLDSVDTRERLLREARAAAALDHPNICPVYEIDEAGGQHFIAMACLEGESLAERLTKGPVPVKAAIDIALQIARGLEAAHSRSIVHRDIKPANLMLSETAPAVCVVRILDFGIARWSDASALTQVGQTLGTVSYMSPEQIETGEVDGRSDLWSLGVVLWQMITGRVLFDRGSTRETLVAIIGANAAELTKAPAVPRRLLSIIRRLLEKDRDRRYPTAAALIADLESVASDLSGVAPRVKRGLIWATGTLVLAGALAAAWFIGTRQRPGLDPPRVVPFTFYPGYEENPAISPDGKMIAFVGHGKDGSNPFEVYVQLIGSTDPLRLTRNAAGFIDRSPVWDPDGNRIAFLRGPRADRFAKLFVIPALGGAETELTGASALTYGRLSWNPNRRSLAFTGISGDQRAIFEVSLDDHSIRQRSAPLAGQNDCCPVFDPTGRHLAFIRNEVEVVIAAEKTTPERALPVRTSWPGLAWTPDAGSLVYSWFGRLAKYQLPTGVIQKPDIAVGSSIRDINIRGQHMAYVRWDFEHSIWKLTVRRSESKSEPRFAATGNVPLIASTLREDTPGFSPDGQWIAFASERSGSTDIWVGRRDGTELRRLTFLEGQSAGTPRWSPDGKWIVFDARPPSTKPDIYVIQAAGGEPRRLTSRSGGADVPSWSGDGRWIYFHSRSDDQIWKMPPAGGTAAQVTQRGGFEGFESADGRYLYYSVTGQSGLWRLDLVNGTDVPIPELTETGEFRHWALAPRGIYFLPTSQASSKDAAICFYDFTTRSTVPVATVGRLVTAGPGALAVSPDESTLLYVRMDRDNRDIMLVENFR
jgi:eukaryotic-like serine/threonine-protein kinase